MRDIKGFTKLFDINIPDYENFDYYIKQYSKLPQWSHIYDLIKTYEEFESECDDVMQYKFGKANKLIEYLKNTHAYQEINCHPIIDLPTTKNFVYSEDKIYISIDIIKANYSVMKIYDDKNELGESYEDLLSKFDIHPIIAKSKGFRQFIFGNLNPKRQVKAQRVVIEELRKSLQDFNLEEICIKSDEIIYSIDNFDIANDIINSIDNTRFKLKIFKVKKVEDFKLNTYYDTLGNEVEKTLVGCNGSRFFIYLKKLILNENLDIRDLLFKMDGQIAIWNVEGLKLELV